MSYQDLQINLTGKDVSASDSLRALARAAASAARQAGDSLDTMNRRVEDSSARSAGSVMGNFGSRLASWGQAGLAGILGGITASVMSSVTSVLSDASNAIMSELKSTVIDYNAQLENATIGFTTMLGSSGAANKFLGQLQQFAKTTPFQFGDLVTMSQQMMGYGVASKSVIPYLTALGDAAAGSGRGTEQLGNAVLAFEQMSARGRVDLGDMNQLTAAGVPAIKILAAAYHTTTGGLLDMIHTGTLMSSEALPKLIDGIEHGTKSTAALGGMMQKQSGTFQGAMSNIQDAMSMTLSTAFKPFYKAVEDIALGFQGMLNSKTVTRWAAETSAAVGSALKTIGDGFRQVFNDPGMQKSIHDLGAALGTAFKSIAPAIKAMMPDLVKFGKDVFPAIVDGITDVVKHFPSFLKGVQSAVHELAKWGPAVATFIRAGARIIGWLIDCVSAFQQWHDRVNSAIVRFGTSVRRGLGIVVGYFSNVVGKVRGIGGDIVDGFVRGIRGSWSAVTRTIHDLAMKIPAPIRLALGIHSPSKVFHGIGGFIGQGLQNGLAESIPGVAKTAAAVAASVTGMFTGASIAVPGVGAAAAPRITGGSAFGSAVASMTGSGLAAAGGVTVNVTVTGAMVGTTAQLGQVIYQAVQQATRSGSVPKNAFQTL